MRHNLGQWHTRGLSRLLASAAALPLLLLLTLPAHAGPWQRHGEAGPHPQMREPGQWNSGAGFQHQNFPRERQYHQNRGYYMRPQQHPGGEHLPQWYRQHQNLNFQQQERALRRQPGFNKLTPAQRRRVLNRLRYLDAQPPAVRARIMARNEAFERLSPERRQEVRAAAQAFQHMSHSRKEQLGRAFNTLRMLPPGQRDEILNSAQFRSQYSPRERHILSNLLSIEPYQPQQPAPH
ncbi:MAG: DUF3106 domain-containing protein [Acidobacteriaceae bacterium]